MDRLSVDCFPAKEITRDAGFVHRPGNSEASRYAEDKRDKQKDETCGVELQIGNEPLAENSKDGREDVEGQAVAAKEEDPPAPFRGSDSVEPEQGRYGEIGYQGSAEACLIGVHGEDGKQGKDNHGKLAWTKEGDEVLAALTKDCAC